MLKLYMNLLFQLYATDFLNFFSLSLTYWLVLAHHSSKSNKIWNRVTGSLNLIGNMSAVFWLTCNDVLDSNKNTGVTDLPASIAFTQGRWLIVWAFNNSQNKSLFSSQTCCIFKIQYSLSKISMILIYN